MELKDEYGQEFKEGDTLIFMRSNSNYLTLGMIVEINRRGNAKIVEEDGVISSLLLTRIHRITKTTTPAHIRHMEKYLSKTLGRQINKTTDSLKDFLQI